MIFTKGIKSDLMNFRLLTTLSVLILCFPVFSQWTDDTDVNTVISDDEGGKYVPHVAQTSEGFYWISWYGGVENLNMNLSLLDNAGTAIWSQPLVVSNHPQNTWVSDYSLAVDHDGNAVLAFSDLRNGNSDIVVYKISAEGDQLFGNNGVVLSQSSEDEFFPTLCITESNHVVVTWQRENSDGIIELILQRLNTQGEVLWGEEGVVLSDPSVDYNTPVPIASEDDGAIVLYFLQTGPFFSPIRTLHAQRFDEAGEAVWTEHATLCEEASIPGYFFPHAKSDGSGGLITSWTDDRDENMLGNVAVQRVLSDGSVQFGEYGRELTAPETFGHFSPQTAGINDLGEIVVYWRTTSANQAQSGLRVQKVTSDGSLAWGATGIELLALGSDVEVINDAVQLGDSSWVSYTRLQDNSPTANLIQFFGVDGFGDIILNAESIATAMSEKASVELSEIYDGQVVAVWTNDDTTPKVKAQAFQLVDTMMHIDEPMTTNALAFRQLGSSIVIEDQSKVKCLKLYTLTGLLVQQFNCDGQHQMQLPNDLAHSVYILVAENHQGAVIQSARIIW